MIDGTPRAHIPRASGLWAAQEGALRIAAILSMLIAVVLWVGPAVFRVDIFDGDAAHHVFWLYQYADPALFPGDITVEYLRTMAPLGYRILYSGLAPIMDALLATELFSAVLLAASGWFAWKAATAIDAPDSALRGLLAVVALVIVVSVARQTGGVLPPLAFQRTFAMPLMLFSLWALIARRYVWVGGSWLGSALFYPALLPVLGLAAGCVFLRDLVVERRMPQAWMLNGLMGVGALALALFAIPSADWLGPMVTYKQAISMPEFGPAGRLRLYADGFSNDWRFHMTGLGWSAYMLLAIAGSVLLIWIRRQYRLIPIPAWALVGVGVGLWLLMRIFSEQLMFGLYLPNRHSRWAIATFGVIALAGGAYLLIEMGTRWALERFKDGMPQLLPRLVALAAPAVVAIALLPHAMEQLRSPFDQDLENTYAFIGTLPKDTLVAGHPTLINYLPLRARRSVLASTEVSMPWMLKYYEIMKQRVTASLRAAYAVDMAEVDALMAPYGVDVFVTGPSVWKATGYHEPYNTEFVQELLARGSREGFALQSPPPERVLFRSGDYYVLRIDTAPAEKSP